MVDQNEQRLIIENSKQERDIDIMIDYKLKWKEQIANCKEKANASLDLLKRSFKTWTIDSFRVLNKTYVRPHLEFCATIQ